MPLYRYSSGSLDPVDRTSLAAEKIRERQGLPLSSRRDGQGQVALNRCRSGQLGDRLGAKIRPAAVLWSAPERPIL